MGTSGWRQTLGVHRGLILESVDEMCHAAAQNSALRAWHGIRNVQGTQATRGRLDSSGHAIGPGDRGLFFRMNAPTAIRLSRIVGSCNLLASCQTTAFSRRRLSPPPSVRRRTGGDAFNDCGRSARTDPSRLFLGARWIRWALRLPAACDPARSGGPPWRYATGSRCLFVCRSWGSRVACGTSLGRASRSGLWFVRLLDVSGELGRHGSPPGSARVPDPGWLWGESTGSRASFSVEVLFRGPDLITGSSECQRTISTPPTSSYRDLGSAFRFRPLAWPTSGKSP